MSRCVTSGFLLESEQGTSAIVVHHPGANISWSEAYGPPSR
jgi:hypothetical protein